MLGSYGVVEAAESTALLIVPFPILSIGPEGNGTNRKFIVIESGFRLEVQSLAPDAVSCLEPPVHG